MAHRKKTDTGVNERLALLREVFPNIQRHFEERPSGVAKDNLLDAAVAAWTALWIDGAQVDSREYAGEEQQGQ